MENYSIKTLTSISGITRQTLYHYNRLGLVQPSIKISSTNWKYSKREMIRLLQILFYRELDFTLHEIKGIIDVPDLNVKKVLEERKKKTKVKAKDVAALIYAINKKISKARAVQKQTIIKQKVERREIPTPPSVNKTSQ